MLETWGGVLQAPARTSAAEDLRAWHGGAYCFPAATVLPCAVPRFRVSTVASVRRNIILVHAIVCSHVEVAVPNQSVSPNGSNRSLLLLELTPFVEMVGAGAICISA